MKNLIFTLLVFASFSLIAQSAATITVDATKNVSSISPWIYGRNNNTSDDPSKPTSNTNWQLYNDAGLRFYRENGGNNCTKYNWRLKLSSHPDWYNNVYAHNWDYSANTILTKTSGTQGLYAFQLLGKVASNKKNNFSDWTYSQDVGYSSPANNWAGGGGDAKYGGNGGDGDPSLYLMDWPADSTVGILDHWFNTLGYDSTRLQYWNMDNEPEIWSGTHDDEPTSSMTAEAYMQKYFAVAKAVRKKHPYIKIVGPAFANEWTWYNWNNSLVKGIDNKDYSLIEYFIKRIGEEQKASGLKLLDVLDVHFYPGTSGNPDLTLQLHKIWYDSTWVYSGANGVKRLGKWGWDGSITKEYFFERCNQWLIKYVGANHNVKFGIGEYGQIAPSDGTEDPNLIACWYASNLGTFANKGLEFFTPWDWYKGQWEVLHLFSKYYGTFATSATSSLDDVVSGYSSLSNHGDTFIVVLVNKDRTNSRTANVNIQNFTPSGSNVEGYQLASLSGETFVSKSSNALQSKQYTVAGNQMSLSLPKLSVTLLRIPTNSAVQTPYAVEENAALKVNVYPNPAQDMLNIQMEKAGVYTVSIHNILGEKMGEWNSAKQVDISSFAAGNYIVQIKSDEGVVVKKVVKN
ncbi:MAG: T9SS type A sorting domain-containing protein [Bacteroidetes bacterium]|nr:T9SS type A sorting domain-containing protein [Bacteroidota bacterium]